MHTPPLVKYYLLSSIHNWWHPRRKRNQYTSCLGFFCRTLNLGRIDNSRFSWNKENSMCCCVMAQRYWILEYHWPPPFDGSLHAHYTSTEKLIFTLCNILHICIFTLNAKQPIAEQNTCCNINIAKGTTDPGVDCFNQITKLKNQITSPWATQPLSLFKNRSKFSHLLTVRTEGADPFRLTVSLTLTVKRPFFMTPFG